MDAWNAGSIKAKLSLVFSNVPGAKALERAEQEGIDALSISSKEFMGSREKYDQEILNLCENKKIDLICLAGYMRILTPVLIKPFLYRMMNIHPALLPKFGGEGMYGHHVHEAVIAAKEKNQRDCAFCDRGRGRGSHYFAGTVPVSPKDTPETLAEKVLKVEHQIYPEAVKLFCEGKVKVESGRVKILH